jgi:2-haloacid dehalogenase
LSVLKCQPGEVLHVGDSQRADVVGAKRAGMLAAWLNRRSHKLRPGIPIPDYEITNLRDLLDLDL